jgi:hypothetical protein
VVTDWILVQGDKKKERKEVRKERVGRDIERGKGKGKGQGGQQGTNGRGRGEGEHKA